MFVPKKKDRPATPYRKVLPRRFLNQSVDEKLDEALTRLAWVERRLASIEKELKRQKSGET